MFSRFLEHGWEGRVIEVRLDISGWRRQGRVSKTNVSCQQQAAGLVVVTATREAGHRIASHRGAGTCGVGRR